MYRQMGVIAGAWLALLGAASALEEGGEAALKQLLAAMKQEVGPSEPGAAENAQFDPRKGLLLKELEDVPHETSEQVQALDKQVAAVSQRFVGAAVREAALKLRQEIDRQAKAEKAAGVEGVIERLRQAVRTAKEPSQLDAIIEELQQELRSHQLARTDWEREQLAVLDRGKDFSIAWQDYLSAVKRNDSSSAIQALNGLSSSDRFRGIIPRSEILDVEAKAMVGTTDREAVVLVIKSLEDISSALGVLQRAGVARDQIQNNIFSALSAIDDGYRHHLAGLPVAMQFGYFGGGYGSPECTAKILELRAQFLKRIIPQQVGAPKGTVAKECESVDAFLTRIEGEAVAAEDPLLALRIRELKNAIAKNSLHSSKDTMAVGLYTSGLNQEQAGQYELAVASYQNALRGGSAFVPAKAIGKRLDAIKQAHPTEYDRGMNRFLKPDNDSEEER